MSQDRSIAVAFHKQTEKEKNEHRIRLDVSIKAYRFLLKNALPFRGHDESEMSISKGMFLETLALIGDCNEDVANGIKALDMEDRYSKNGRQMTNITNCHYYKFDIFNTVVDMQIQEFGDRFSEVSTELLKNIAALSPCDSFSQFNVSDLLKLSELYPHDFSHMERIALEKQLNMYYLIVRQDERFANLSGIAEPARLLVKTKKHQTYPLVYRLLKLALVFPVATATVERCFSSMKIVKSDLRNKIGDEVLNAAMICTIEKEALLAVSNDDVITQFQKMKSHRTQL
ncbi:uncharacterized protein LOC112506164 [Cynara cardunculus var. scolymus]|uniref:uncharacterized protein LOC112506164 n=1 Tax=Cynara cardunculus var. scolymus TaxID=59895 RepID=UPI000D62A520|nr:uncharacterized protein LOC112506164 [Cynara cardunculus var. scolymus]